MKTGCDDDRKAINAEDYTDAAPVEVKVDATADDGSTVQDIPF